MQLERNKDQTFNVWMTRTEYEHLPRNARDYAHEVAIRLMGESGLRVAEVAEVAYDDVKRSTDGQHYRLRVQSGKDTTGEYETGKYREAWLPASLERQMYRFTQERNIEPDEPLFDVSKRTLQNWVSYAANDTAEATDEADYRRVSAHDLRRSWAHDLLVEQRVAVRVVMAIGGWSSYDAIEPYLTHPSEQNIIDEMSGATL
jgi:integrase